MLNVANKSYIQVLFFPIIIFAARLRTPVALNTVI